MSRYRFVLENYHAVHKADIDIDGITVLAGPNGCGKSTVARWLNFCVTTLTDYESFINNRFRSDIGKILSRLERSLRSLRGTDLRRRMAIYHQMQYVEEIGDVEELKDLSRRLLDDVADFIDENITRPEYENDFERLQDYFGLERVEGEDAGNISKRISSSLHDQLEDAISARDERFVTQSQDNFTEALKVLADPMIDDYPIKLSMDFFEDGTDLLGDVFKVPLMLDRSIYLNTQSLGRSLDDDKSRLGKMLNDKAEVVPEEAELVADVIKLIINGDVEEEKKDLPYLRKKRLQYVRKDGMKIYLKEAATGIISFSYILRLLENGWITKESLLIIDEPEAHLHPQWIVDYARILVLINKKVGAKVVISSHNPDMVAAIQSVSRKEGLLDRVHFYVAEETEPGCQLYDFHDLGHEVGKIFDSFNIALDRISIYGEEE